jgi:hypothetical protein
MFSVLGFLEHYYMYEYPSILIRLAVLFVLQFLFLKPIKVIYLLNPLVLQNNQQLIRE